MGDSPLGFFERMKARKKDIDLPNKSGRTDPRLEKPDVLGAFKKAGEGLKALRAGIDKATR